MRTVLGAGRICSAATNADRWMKADRAAFIHMCLGWYTKKGYRNGNDAIYRSSGSLSESRNVSSDKVQDPFFCGQVTATVAHQNMFSRLFGRCNKQELDRANST